MTQDLYNENILSVMNKYIMKMESGDQLSFEDQCVLVVLSSVGIVRSGSHLSSDVLKKLSDVDEMETHPFIYEFIDSLPSEKQISMLRFGAILLGCNVDGSENKLLSKIKPKPRINTYIVRKCGTNEVKIGKSINCSSRIRTLSTQGGVELEVLCIIKENIEHELHRRFSKYRTIGEWFDDTDGEISKFAESQRRTVDI